MFSGFFFLKNTEHTENKLTSLGLSLCVCEMGKKRCPESRALKSSAWGNRLGKGGLAGLLTQFTKVVIFFIALRRAMLSPRRVYLASPQY